MKIKNLIGVPILFGLLIVASAQLNTGTDGESELTGNESIERAPREGEGLLSLLINIVKEPAKAKVEAVFDEDEEYRKAKDELAALEQQVERKVHLLTHKSKESIANVNHQEYFKTLKERNDQWEDLNNRKIAYNTVINSIEDSMWNTLDHGPAARDLLSTGLASTEDRMMDLDSEHNVYQLHREKLQEKTMTVEDAKRIEAEVFNDVSKAHEERKKSKVVITQKVEAARKKKEDAIEEASTSWSNIYVSKFKKIGFWVNPFGKHSSRITSTDDLKIPAKIREYLEERFDATVKELVKEHDQEKIGDIKDDPKDDDVAKIEKSIRRAKREYNLENNQIGEHQYKLIPVPLAKNPLMKENALLDVISGIADRGVKNDRRHLFGKTFASKINQKTNLLKGYIGTNNLCMLGGRDVPLEEKAYKEKVDKMLNEFKGAMQRLSNSCPGPEREFLKNTMDGKRSLIQKFFEDVSEMEECSIILNRVEEVLKQVKKWQELH